ncbi:patatin-like phospholipase domain-containing protein 2 [Clytia hemisphaerica]|uniref:triacylglycerol lipase n=1 Tax=Clytia hemisphaerica TaxID=252671 RepID=A0A7M5WMN8_9CNID
MFSKSEDLNLAFSGAGFMGIYHIGVVSCLKFYGKKLLENIECVGGSSAGALTACMLLCDTDLEASVQFTMHLASKVHGKVLGPLSPEFEPCEKIRKTFMTHLPSDAYKKVSGKLYVSLTRVSDWENVIVSDFASNKELVDALVCTSFIPFFSGVLPPKFRGVSYIDGGFTDNMPQHFNGITITISPFGGESDICPNDTHKSQTNFDMRNTSIQFTSHNIYRMTRALFPPDNDVLSEMCRQGYRDTLRYLHNNYPEMLSFDVAIVSIPQCCGFATETSDDEGSICSCGNATSSCFSDMEHTIAKGNMIDNLVTVPDQLNKILLQTKILFQQSDLCWYFIRTFSNIAQWIAKPCIYATEHVSEFLKELFHYMIPRIRELCAYNFYTKKAFDIAFEVIQAYQDKVNFEWHPSMKEEHHNEVEKKKRRILTAQKSLVTIPIVKNDSLLKIDEEKSGLDAPPPSRVSSFVKLTDLDIVSKLNSYVFDEQVLFSDHSSSPDLTEEDDYLAEVDEDGKTMFCVKDDDGLVLKFDRSQSTYDPDDYGSELQLYPDPVYDALVVGQKRRKFSFDSDVDSWDDFVEINGCDA